MPALRPSTRSLEIGVFALVIACFCGTAARTERLLAFQANEPAHPEEGEDEDEPAAKSLRNPRRTVEDLRNTDALPPSEDVPAPLDPIKKRSPEEQKKIDAMARYMTGRIKQTKNDLRGAYAEFEKAIELDPSSAEVYRALVPLAFDLKKNKEALKFAEKAIELNPNDHELLRRLGRHMAEHRNLNEALRFLEKAAASNIPKDSSDYVMLMRDLAVLYTAADQKQKAADAWEIVLDALIDPEKHGLEYQERATLLGDSTTTFEAIGQVLMDAERLDAAVRAFEAAAKARRGNPAHLSYNLARVYLKTKHPDQALEELQKYFDAQLQSKGRGAYDLLAEILKELNRSDELLGRLETLAENDSRNSTLQFYLADAYVNADQFDKAEALYKKTLESSKDVDGYVGLASIYRRAGRTDELLEVLGRSLSASRDTRQLAGTLNRLDTELKAIVADKALFAKLLTSGRKLSEGDEPKIDFAGCIVLANLASEAGQTDDVIHFYKLALKLRPELAGLIVEELGNQLLQADRYEEAVQTYQDALKDASLSEAKPNLLFRLSQALEYSGKTKEALEAIREARGIAGNNPLLDFQEAWIHYHAKQFDEAEKAFEQVIEKHPQASEVVKRSRFSLSNLYVQKGDMKKGEGILEAVLADEPDDPSVNNDLGYLYADQGKNLEQAEKMIRKAITAEPENTAYQDSMGWVLFKLGKYDEAIEYLQKAASKPGDTDATIWDHLGDCQEKLKQTDKAVESWRKALEDARKNSQPDAKLIERLTEKLKSHGSPVEASKPAASTTP